MALTTSQPNEQFPYLSLTMAMAPRIGTDNIQTMVSVLLKPYSISEDGAVIVGEAERSMVWSDVFTAVYTDPALATFVGKFLTAAQEFINAKGL